MKYERSLNDIPTPSACQCGFIDILRRTPLLAALIKSQCYDQSKCHGNQSLSLWSHWSFAQKLFGNETQLWCKCSASQWLRLPAQTLVFDLWRRRSSEELISAQTALRGAAVKEKLGLDSKKCLQTACVLPVWLILVQLQQILWHFWV